MKVIGFINKNYLLEQLCNCWFKYVGNSWNVFVLFSSL